MNSSFWKKLLPHIIAVAIFLLLSIIYCQPSLQGKVLNQHDVLGWKGMAQQSFEFKEKYGHFPLWTNSLFGGMPAFAIAMDAKHSIGIGYFYTIFTLGLPKPISFFFLACISFYFLCNVLRIRPWLSVIGAIAFAYSTFDAIIVGVGHDTQMQALALMPAVIGSFLLLLQGRYLWGLALLTITSGLEISTQHLQIAYYTLIIVALISVFYLIKNYREHNLTNTLKGFGLALIAGVLGFCTAAIMLLPLQDYAKETMRGGKSELTKPGEIKNKSKGGLDKDYAFNWSYGIGESFTLFVPGIYGGSNGGNEHSGSTNFSDKLNELGIPEETAVQMENGYSYWGDQPNTSGPVYLGAVVCFLFIFGMIYVKSWHKWWIIVATVLGIFMAWGKNFSFLNYFLFDNLPFYNKFRAPTMALIIPQFTFPLLAALGLEQLMSSDESRELAWKKFKSAVFITAGIFAILLIFYVVADFKSPNDQRIRQMFAMQMSQGKNSPDAINQSQTVSQGLIKVLQDDRRSLFLGDFFRSFILVALTVVLVGLFLKQKLKPIPVIVGIFLLSSYDLLAVDRRYLNNDNFVEPDEFASELLPNTADKQILADPNKPFRVFDETDPNGPFNSSRAAYFHNSVGGYNAAKLALYQDLIENELSKGNMQVFNMLNTKYFIEENTSTRQPEARFNPGAFGPCWLVKGIKYVRNSDEEMKALDSTNLRDTAVIQERFKPEVKFEPQSDSSATIKLVANINDTVRYSFRSNKNQFAVFSEIYYPRGWNAYIDQKKVDYVKIDYVLRGMSIPAGDHAIEFRFEPGAYELGNTLTMIASIITYLILIIAIVFEFRRKKT